MSNTYEIKENPKQKCLSLYVNGIAVFTHSSILALLRALETYLYMEIESLDKSLSE